MTYALVVLPFLVVTAAVTALSARRTGFASRMRASLITAVVLVVLTVVFDNLMIGLGLFSYPVALISGLRVGLAPVEDLSYPLAAAFGAPAVFALLRREQAP